MRIEMSTLNEIENYSEVREILGQTHIKAPFLIVNGTRGLSG